MSDEMTPLMLSDPPPTGQPARRRPGLGTALLIVLLTTAPLFGLLYAGAQLLKLPFTPFDLVDWPVRAGFGPWVSLLNTLNGAQEATGGNIAQSALLVQWLLATALFFLLALLVGLAFYVFVARRDRAPDWIDGLVVGLLFGAPMIFISLTASATPMPALLSVVWLGALFLAWGMTLSYAFGRLIETGGTSGEEAPSEGGIDRRQFLLQFGAGAAAVTAISAAAGAVLAPGQGAARLQRTLPMISPEFLEAQETLFGNFRRFVIVRGNTESAAESNVVALGAEYPDRNYVSIWLGGGSPIVVYENLATALSAYSTEEAEAGLYWLDE